MEYLDYYDAEGNFLGKESRQKIHEKGLWHKTVHCWLYDDLGNIYFQIRADDKKMYTTASGHVSAGETLNEAFAREVKEEIGLEIDAKNTELIKIVVWKMDKKGQNGAVSKDRAFANIYASKINPETKSFVFDSNEVSGLIKINAEKALKILLKELDSAEASRIDNENKWNKTQISMDDFLIFGHEIGIIKYGRVLQYIIDKTRA